MKKHSFSSFAVTMLMAFLVSFTLSSCSEEIVEDKQENQETQEEDLDLPKDAIVFTTGGDETTRTSLDLNAYFYWTADDKIWVDVAEDGSYATSSDDMEMSSDKRLAKFIFTGETMDADSYELTYTGIDATSGTKVIIAQDQSQAPNLPAKIGEYGDCATAVATKNAKGQYVFTLSHKAHYLIFQPYKDSAIPQEWRLKNIEIISLDDENLCGTYDFDKDGLDASSVTSANTSVTIGTGTADGVLLNNSKSDDNPAWYVVIAPTTATSGKHWLRIKYRIKPAAEVNYYKGESQNEDFVIVKDVEINSAPNKVTKIAHKMTVESFPTSVFYMWDATAPYWQDISNPATYYGADNANCPQSGKRFTTVTAPIPAGGQAAANSPCKHLPNVNALTWYAMAGDARWETEYPWVFDNDYRYIYTQGTWMLKWEHIVAANSVLAGKTKTNCDVSFTGTVTVYLDNSTDMPVERTYNGTDYRSNKFPMVTIKGEEKDVWFQPRFQSYKTNGRPKDVSRYFFLPANGHFETYTSGGTTKGHLNEGGGIHGCYWASSAVPGTTNPVAHIIETKSFSLQVRQDNAQIYHSNSDKMKYNGRPAAPDWWK